MSRPYARIYFQDLQRDYPEVWNDPAALGTYVQLLGLSEAVWPGEPDLPRSVRARSLAILTGGRGLVSVVGHSFRIKGFHVERTRRQDAARDAAAKRWQSGGNADA